MDIVAIDARQGKRGKRETVKFAGTEAKEQIDSYINEVHMAKEDMSESASAAASSAKLAESWATGGTFARGDEDVNNAKYWAEYAHAAEEHVIEAENAVMSAETKALAAAALSETHAATSESHAEISEQKAELSESWAVGGTGKRDGEDTNNSKYWAEQAAESASKAGGSAAGVSTFNGRSGDVSPQAGDYSYDMITGTPPATSVDADVIEGSSNAVSSGGAYTAIKAVKDSIVSTVTANIATIKTAIGNASTSAAGLMSGEDKTKLDNLIVEKRIEKTLTAGMTELTFTDEAITDKASIYIEANIYGVIPINAAQNDNTVTLTFEAQETDLTIVLVIS